MREIWLVEPVVTGDDFQWRRSLFAVYPSYIKKLVVVCP
jgi:hypothetical protein